MNSPVPEPSAPGQRTIVVTGAAGGMGAGTCQLLADQGNTVLAIDQNAGTLQALVAHSSRIHALAADISTADWLAPMQQQLAALPPLSGIVNMAGISHGSPIDQLDDEAWEQSFAVNVTAAMRLIRALAPALRQRGAGSIVNVGSPVGLIGARKPSYAASKGALHGLTMACARNLGPDNIRVNLLLPGTTITGMTQDWDAQRRAAVAQGNFLQRLCTPAEIAQMVAFLLSDACSYMTGSVVDMTAGGLWGH